MVVAKEAVGSLGSMVRQLGLDQLENESRRMAPLNTDLSQPTRNFARQESSRGLRKKVLTPFAVVRSVLFTIFPGKVLETLICGCFFADYIFIA